MKLSLKGIEDRKAWESRGYRLPQYDIPKMIGNTKENPFWIHFGAGNLFRAFHADIVQNMLNEGCIDRGIIAAEGFDYEIIEKMYAAHDNLGILATLKADGTIEKTVTASVAEAVPLDAENEKAFWRLKDIFTKESLQMATFTITEKGYSLRDAKGELFEEISEDFVNGYSKPASYMGKVASLLYARYQSGRKPIAMISTDNCSHNGDKLYEAVISFAKAWEENGRAEKGFAEYLDSDLVSFNWSVIDKITPRPDAAVEAVLREDGVEDLMPVVTSKNTYAAPYVNAEETAYLVIEDVFPNGRPALEKAGVMFADRETVDKVEKMKVCTCLNPLHTCLAVFGCLLGYKKISEEMKDSELKRLVERVGYIEGLPVVADPGIINPKEFIDTVLNVRVTNPFMPDTPQRIATDTSQKLAIRFGETVKAYEKSSTLKVEDLKMIPLVFAGWLRYMMGIDDNGEAFERSPDPLLDEVGQYLNGMALGAEDVEPAIRPVMQRADIFGVDLYQAGLAERVCGYFKELAAGKGAVRETLKKYVWCE